jgi:hypothetical protein
MKNKTFRNRKKALSRDDLKRGLVTGGTVTLATLGCSSCNDNGAVDPPPPPLVCGDVEAGQTLYADGFRSGSELRVQIHRWGASWTDVPAVLDLEGLTLVHADLSSEGTVLLQFGLISETAPAGRFTISGNMKLTNGEICTVTRRFTVTIRGESVEVAEAWTSLPLENRNRARIELVHQEGLAVLLRAAGASPGWKLVWSSTEGSLEQRQNGVLWTLPAEPGFYQVELLTDHGDAGFAVDILPFEVS